jgi:predicted transcriptional regulator
MSEGRITKALKTFGLSTIDIPVYIFLAKTGPCRTQKIEKDLKLEKGALDKSLKDLSNLGIITFSIKDPSKFTAMPFEDVISLIIEIKKEQAETLKATKEELLSAWRSLTEKDDEKS